MRKRKVPSRQRTPGRAARFLRRKAKRVLSVFTAEEQAELIALVGEEMES